MLKYYATISRAPRKTKMIEARVVEDPPGAEVVVSGSGNIGSSALHLYHDMIIIKPNSYKCLFGPNLSLEQKQISTSVVTEMLLLLGKVASSTLKQELGCSLQ